MRVTELDFDTEICLPTQEATPPPFPKTPLIIAGPLVGRIFAFEPIQPEIFDLKLEEHPFIRFEWGNGIRNSLDESKQSALLVSQLAGNYNVHALYNPTFGPIADLFRSIFEWRGADSVISRRMQEEWLIYFQSSPPENIIVHVSHSEGVLQVYRALLGMPKEYRSRIYIIAVAPPIFIPEHLCARVVHLVSEKDYVPIFAKKNALDAGQLERLKILPPHPTATGWDHHFGSLTYRDALEEELLKFKEGFFTHMAVDSPSPSSGGGAEGAVFVLLISSNLDRTSSTSL